MIRDITIGQYYPAKSVLHRLDPRVKLVGTLLYLISLFLFNSIPGYVMTTLFLILVIRISKVPFSFIVRGLKPVIMLLMITVLFNLFLTRDGAVLFHAWIFTITEGGLRTADRKRCRSGKRQYDPESKEYDSDFGSFVCVCVPESE